MIWKKDASSVKEVPPSEHQGTEVSAIKSGIVLDGRLSGTGDVLINGTYSGDISLDGTLTVQESGKVTCEKIKAETVNIFGAIEGSITARNVNILSTGRVWGNIVAVSLTTEEGAFLRGQVQMEEEERELEPEEDSGS